jgi:hypothetical protein
VARDTDITGCSLKFTAKRSLQDSDADAVFQLTTPSRDCDHQWPKWPVYRSTSPALDTSGLLVPTLCYCDLQLVDTLGNVSTTATGTLLIKVDVTRTDT